MNRRGISFTLITVLLASSSGCLVCEASREPFIAGRVGTHISVVIRVVRNAVPASRILFLTGATLLREHIMMGPVGFAIRHTSAKTIRVGWALLAARIVSAHYYSDSIRRHAVFERPLPCGRNRSRR